MTSQAAGTRADETPLERDFGSARAHAGVVYESGIPPRGDAPRAHAPVNELDERIQFALADSARLEMNLRLLVRGLKQLVAAAASVEQTHGSLVNELSELRKLVLCGRAGDSGLRTRIEDLERALARTRSSAAQEKSSLIQEQEALLKRLLTEHEQELDGLRRLLPSPSNPASDSASELDAEPFSSAIPARAELPSSECLEVHWEDLEETATRSATPAARSSRPPPLPEHARDASKRTS